MRDALATDLQGQRLRMRAASEAGNAPRFAIAEDASVSLGCSMEEVPQGRAGAVAGERNADP